MRGHYGLLLFVWVLWIGNKALAEPGSYRERVRNLEDQVSQLAGSVGVLQQELKMLRIEIRSLRDRQGDAQPVTAAQDAGPAEHGQGTWVVRITSNPQPDTDDLDQQLDVQRNRLTSIGHQLSEARQRFQEVSRTRHVWSSYYDRYEVNQQYSAEAIQDAKQAVEKLEQEKREVEANTVRLERKIAILKSVRVVAGEAEDGTPVQIQAKGTSAQIAADMTEGQWYRVTGLGRQSNGVLSIGLRTASPVNQE